MHKVFKNKAQRCSTPLSQLTNFAVGSLHVKDKPPRINPAGTRLRLNLNLLPAWKRSSFVYGFVCKGPNCSEAYARGGGTRMARGGIRLVHGLTKSTLITYFSGMKIDPKYAFLHAFFLICPSCSFQNLSI